MEFLHPADIVAGIMVIVVGLGLALKCFDAYTEAKEATGKFEDAEDYILRVARRHEHISLYGETKESVEYRNPVRSNMRND